MKAEHVEAGESAASPSVIGTDDAGAQAAQTPRSRRAGVFTALAIAALVVAAVWAYRANMAKPSMDASMNMTGGAAAFPVTLGTVERGAIAASVTYTGTVAPFNETDIYPRVTGRLVDIPVYPGDRVRRGQVVARLDDAELGSRVREATAGAQAASASVAQMEAEVAGARHGVVQTEREVAMAIADVAAARSGVVQSQQELVMAEAEASYQEQLILREEQLFERGAVSRQDLENARAVVAAARAKVQAGQARVEQSRAAVAASEAKAEAAQAKLEQARAMQASAVRRREAMSATAAQNRAMLDTASVIHGYVNITAPSDGDVVKRLVAPGVLVQPGMAILKIAEIGRVRLQANVGERDLQSIRVGSPVTVTPLGAVAPVTARVTSVFPFVDAGARTAVVEALVDNVDRRFLPGQYVLMQFVTGERPAGLTVPRGAVARLGDRSRVWVAVGDRAQARTVVTGLQSSERVEIADGLRGDERVIVRGYEGLYDGARIAEVAPPPGRGIETSTTGGPKPPTVAPGPASSGHSH